METYSFMCPRCHGSMDGVTVDDVLAAGPPRCGRCGVELDRVVFSARHAVEFVAELAEQEIEDRKKLTRDLDDERRVNGEIELFNLCRPLVIGAVEMLADAVESWPQAFSDEEIAGSDAVEWLVPFVQQAQTLLSSVVQTQSAD